MENMKTEEEISAHADMLRNLGFPEGAIKEAVNSMRSGSFNLEPSPDLTDRIMEKCRKILEKK